MAAGRITIRPMENAPAMRLSSSPHHCRCVYIEHLYTPITWRQRHRGGGVLVCWEVTGRRLTERGHSLSQICGAATQRMKCYCRIVVYFSSIRSPWRIFGRFEAEGSRCHLSRAASVVCQCVNQRVDNPILCLDSDSRRVHSSQTDVK